MKTLNILALLACSALLWACEKEIPLDIEDAQPKIVVNSLFDTDSTWVVEVSKSRNILEEDAELSLLTNASVRLLNPDGTTEIMQHEGDGIFTSPSTPQRGNTYRLEVDAPDLESVWAENTLDNGVEVVSIDTSSTTEWDARLYELAIRIKDVPNVRNFYNIKLRGQFWEYIWNDNTQELDSSLVYGTLFFTSEDPVLTGSESFFDGDFFGQRGASFNDDLFEGGERTVVIEVYSWNQELIDVTVSSGSEEFYLYEVSYGLYQESRDNPFAQPVQVYTNANNGLGIFAGVSSVTERIAVE